MQYSQYSGSVTTTTAPVATVGGEPGGRAAIVVEDAAPAEVNTAVPSGIVAEPGKDVFAQEHKDVKSVASSGIEGSEGSEGWVVSVVGSEEEPAKALVGSDAPRRPDGPLDHEEALADQVAQELYPDADAARQQYEWD